MKLSSYPKVWNLGHAAIAELLLDPVVVEEKLDGSQFSFGVVDGVLCCRSRNQELDVDGIEESHMFYKAVQTAKSRDAMLVEGWVYRGEYLNKPKHNTLCYQRTPGDYVMLWDVQTGPGAHLPPAEKASEAARLDLECAPMLFEGKLLDVEALHTLLEGDSVLGGLIEGVVIKNYHRWGKDGKMLAGKHVSEKFREIHGSDWKKRHPGGTDIQTQIVGRYKTEARWHKAVQHLRERGELVDEPKDIGPLLRELNRDLEEECAEPIKEELWQWARKNIMRRSAGGFAVWYKDQLMRKQFE